MHLSPNDDQELDLGSFGIFFSTLVHLPFLEIKWERGRRGEWIHGDEAELRIFFFLVLMAAGVYPMSALMNHSCKPNVGLAPMNENIYWVATRDIKIVLNIFFFLTWGFASSTGRAEFLLDKERVFLFHESGYFFVDPSLGRGTLYSLRGPGNRISSTTGIFERPSLF